MAGLFGLAGLAGDEDIEYLAKLWTKVERYCMGPRFKAWPKAGKLLESSSY
jgi:hypothetical protein